MRTSSFSQAGQPEAWVAWDLGLPWELGAALWDWVLSPWDPTLSPGSRCQE